MLVLRTEHELNAELLELFDGVLGGFRLVLLSGGDEGDVGRLHKLYIQESYLLVLLFVLFLLCSCKLLCKVILVPLLQFHHLYLLVVLNCQIHFLQDQ